MLESDYWSDSSVFVAIPNFTCPSCNIGSLIFSKILKIENDTADPEYQKYITKSELVEKAFCVILRCNNDEGCNDSIVLSGKRIVHHVWEEDFYDERDECHQKFVYRFHIKYIDPAPNIISLPNRTPKEVREYLAQSFSLFWIDENSCANKIRAAVEALLTYKKMPRTKILKRKRKNINLHGRIEAFSKKDKENGNLLMAIK